jgi:transposase IS66 family protein
MESQGPGVRAWVLALYYEGGMSEPKILEVLQTVGMEISAGQLSDMLIKNQEVFHAERAAVVALLRGYDAPQFNALTAELALCWIHEFRHYKKLRPRFTHHCTLLQDFGKAFWKLYQGLLDYRNHPDPAQAAALQACFDQLFAESSGYQQLDECKERTLKKRDQLLMVLSHPEILLHNNPAELGARQRVRKRDVSLQARTLEGIGAWDTFQTLVATAKKLGVNLFHYFSDRLT